MEKKIDIQGRYYMEISAIEDKLNQLESGRIYNPALGNKMDGSLQTNIRQLKEMLMDLLHKIEYDKKSDGEKLTEAFIK